MLLKYTSKYNELSYRNRALYWFLAVTANATALVTQRLDRSHVPEIPPATLLFETERQ